MKTCSASLIICLLDPRWIDFARTTLDYVAQAVPSNFPASQFQSLYGLSNFSCFGQGWHRAAHSLYYLETKT